MASLLKELQRIEAELQQVQAELQEKRQALLQQHLDAREATLARRNELVNGLSRASDAELEGYTGPRTTGAIKPLPVPSFWLHALSAEPKVARWITPADRAALELLLDVRVLRGAAGLLLEFAFPPDNPFFENTVLRRGVAVEKDAEGRVVDARDEGTVVEWKEGRSLLVQRVQRGGGGQGGKKGKKKKGAAQGGGKGAKAGKGRAAAATEPDEDADDAEEEPQQPQAPARFKPAPSFFRFFTPLHRPKVIDPTVEEDEDDAAAHDDDDFFLGDDVPGDDDDDEAEDEEDDDDDEEGGAARDPEARRRARLAQRKAQRDMELLDVIVRRVIPHAATLYLEGLQAGASALDDEDDAGFTVVRPPPPTAAASSTSNPSQPPPAAVQQAQHALTAHNQRQLDGLALEFKKAKWAAAQEADKKEQALLDRRAALLGRSAGPLRRLPAAARGPAAAVTTGLPLFWLRALRGCEGGEACVHRRDELALACLGDVRARWDWAHMPTAAEPWRKVTVEWTFLDNPYFPAGTLSKTYTFTCDGGSANKLGLQQRGAVVAGPQWFAPTPGGQLPKAEGNEGAEEEGEEGAAAPQLRPGQHPPPGRCDLTLAPPAAARRGKESKHRGKPAPALSFFNIFKDGYLRHAFGGLEGAPGSAQQDREALAAEEALLGTLTGPLRYAPSALYDAVEVEEEDLGHEWNEHDELDEDDEDGEDDEDEEEEGEGGDGESEARRAARAARAKAARRGKAQRDGGAGGGGGGMGKYALYVGLLLLLVLAQVFVWIDMFFLSPKH